MLSSSLELAILLPQLLSVRHVPPCPPLLSFYTELLRIFNSIKELSPVSKFRPLLLFLAAGPFVHNLFFIFVFRIKCTLVIERCVLTVSGSCRPKRKCMRRTQCALCCLYTSTGDLTAIKTFALGLPKPFCVHLCLPAVAKPPPQKALLQPRQV